PCPPSIVGGGIGGNFERVAYCATKAWFCRWGRRHPSGEVAGVEGEVLTDINALGIGPHGMRETTTAHAAHVGDAATHIASFPVAVNINCHANRHKTAVL